MVDNVGSKVSQAIGAYLNTAKIADKVSAGEDDSFSFGNLVKSAIDQVAKTQKKSEAVSAQAVIGKADLTDVVQAVTDAELTLQTVMTVRDRLIGAYQDIMRMPI
ncbi:MAG: flagellar hook-basal body complex protein FliE [Proteobacteria bacterium]|nr:flagellar hook-basal body complex protein FliE [Pseudomonadota bacterium]